MTDPPYAAQQNLKPGQVRTCVHFRDHMPSRAIPLYKVEVVAEFDFRFKC